MAETTVLQIDFGNTLNEIVQIKDATAGLVEQNKELKKAIDGDTEALDKYGGSVEAVKIQLAQNEAQIKANNKEQRTLTNIVGEATKANNANTGSLEQNKAALKVLEEAYSKLGRPTIEQTKKLATLRAEIERQEKAIGKTKFGVANYTTTINNALGSIKIFGTDLGQFTNVMSQSGVSIKSATSSVGGFSKALISTGIGALVVGLGLLIANFDKIQKAFAENREAVNKWAKVLVFVSVPLAVTIKALQFLQDNLAEIQQTLAGLVAVAESVFNSIAEAADAFFSFDPARVKAAFANAGQEAQKAFFKGQQEEQKRQAKVVQDELLKASIERRQLELNILEAQGKDTFEFRKKLLQDELSLLDKSSKEFAEKFNEIAVLIAKREKEQSDQRIETIANLGKLTGKATKEAQNDITKEFNEGFKRRKEANAIALAQEKLDLQVALDTNLAAVGNNQIARERILIEHNQKLQQLDFEYREKELLLLQEQGENIAAKELELKAAKIESNRKYNDAITQNNQQAADEQVSIQQKLLEEEQRITEARVALADEYLTNFNALLNLFAENSAAAAVFQKAQALFQIGVDTARSISAGIAGATTSAAATGPGAFVATPIFIATTIATILGSMAQAIAVIKGTKPSSPPKFAGGGEIDVGGLPHSQGGTTYVGEDGNAFEVERGEKIFVMKTTASEEMDKYSRWNQMFGGKPWTKQTRYAAEGGTIPIAPSFDGGLSAREASANIDRNVKNIPSPVVRVTEINRVQRTTDQSVTVSEL